MSAGERVLELGEGLALPVSAVTHTIAVVGQKRTGKTSSAVVAVEEAAAAGACFGVIDPTDAWSGLRSNAAGDGPGLDCIVMGGLNGDVPLSADAGRVVARLIVTDGYRIVCSLKRMPRSEQVRFVADFSEEVLELGRQRAVTVVYDEAPRFVPQSGAGGGSKSEQEDAQRCRRAVTEVVTMGGAQGIGSILIAQRPSAIHKDVFEQAEILIIHRLKGNNDKAAIRGWLEEAGHEEAAALLATLPNLKQGQAIVLASEEDVAQTVTMRQKRTFDSSSTPEVGAVLMQDPQVRPAIDLDALEAKMGSALEAAQENDPDALRKRVKKLEAALAEANTDTRPHGDVDTGYDLKRLEETERELERVREALDGADVGQEEGLPFDVAVLRSAWEEMHREAAGAKLIIEQQSSRLASIAEMAGSTVLTFERIGALKTPLEPQGREDATDGVRTVTNDTASRTPPGQEAPTPPLDRQPDPTDTTAPPVKAGAKRMLTALIDRGQPLTRAELAVLSKVRAGGTMSDYLSALRSNDLIGEAEDKRVTLIASTAALRALGVATEPRARTPLEVVEPHLGDLKAGARRMLDLLMRAHPEGYTRKELGGLAGIAAGGTQSDYLSMLRRRGLIEERSRRIYAGPVLYLWQG